MEKGVNHSIFLLFSSVCEYGAPGSTVHAGDVFVEFLGMLCFGSLNAPCVYLPEDCLLHLLGNDGQRRIAILCLLSCLAKLMVACSKLCSIRHA